jgi:tRNA1(Val) A37 N6-methylase TrmN6
MRVDTAMARPKQSAWNVTHGETVSRRLAIWRVTIDFRFVYLKKQLPVGARILDIGCNVGVFSVALAKHLRARSLLGIDIDVRKKKKKKNEKFLKIFFFFL